MPKMMDDGEIEGLTSFPLDYYKLHQNFIESYCQNQDFH